MRIHKYTTHKLTQSDLDHDQKLVMGRIIDMWSLGRPDHPYEFSDENHVLKYAKKDDLSDERIHEVLNDLEGMELIRKVEENGKMVFKYRAEAEQIVKELQKTTFVNSRESFKPAHHHLH
jgi:hypothetical protein